MFTNAITTDKLEFAQKNVLARRGLAPKPQGPLRRKQRCNLGRQEVEGASFIPRPSTDVLRDRVLMCRCSQFPQSADAIVSSKP